MNRVMMRKKRLLQLILLCLFFSLIPESALIVKASQDNFIFERFERESLAAKDEAALKKEILQAMLDEKESLDVSSYGLPMEDEEDEDYIFHLFEKVFYANPELFYVKPALSMSVLDQKLIQIAFVYKEHTSEQKTEYSEKLEQVMSLVTDEMSDEQKALVLHDYLAQHCTYAEDEYEKGTLDSLTNVYDAYGALVQGYAVCEGYAMAYEALLHEVGIEAGFCESTEMSHAWNVVRIDGEWYHVDVTWDDPAWNKEGRVLHKYFLLSDAEMEKRETSFGQRHYDWYDDVSCTSAKYDNYWWKEIQSQIVLIDGRYFYLEQYGETGFQLTEKTENAVTPGYTNSSRWEKWDGDGYWLGSFAYLSRQGDYLYFNDALNLYATKVSGGEPEVIYTYGEGNGYLYGAMVYEDGTVRLNVAKSPDEKDDSYDSIQIKLTVPVTGVSLSPASLTLRQGDTYKLTAAVVPANANNRDVMWSSGNASVARVAADGTVTAVKTGTAAITVTTVDGGKTGTCVVTVNTGEETVGSVTGVSLNPDSLTLKEGGMYKLTVTITPEDAVNQNVMWNSNNASVARVAADGTVTALKAGTTRITVTTVDGGKTASCVVTVKGDGNTSNSDDENTSDSGSEDASDSSDENTSGSSDKNNSGSNNENNSGSGDKNTSGSSDGNIPVIDGADASYERGSESGITIIAEGDYDLFEDLYIDGIKIDKKNYDVEKGSTIITLKASFLNTLSTGSHKVRIHYKDGKDAKTTLMVTKESKPSEGDTNGSRIPVIDGADASYDKGSGSDLTITADGDYNLYEDLYIDGIKIDKANYEVKEGSTIITLRSSFLDTLSVGSHRVRFHYRDGIDATTTLTVTGESGNNGSDSNGSDNNGSSSGNSNDNVSNGEAAQATGSVVSPKTGDDSTLPGTDDQTNLALCICMAVCAALATGIFIYTRKRLCRVM